MTVRRSRRCNGAILGLSLAGLGALAFAAVATPTPRLVWNASPSAPIGLYRLDPAAPITLGRRVAYRPTPDQARLFAQRGYLPQGVPLLKTVAAVAPAEVCRDGGALRTDGRTVAQARRSDRAGRPLPTWSGCRRLSSDQVLLLSVEAPDSLDGRYFGPVSRGRILGVVTPLWTREPVR
jgi:conjugative transfer signal peptidase TraF